jgi:Trk-type K+ transport system membrane component
MAQEEFLDAMFEVVSALGTVGLSTGLTPKLSDAGKLIIMALMFVGRLGPISVFVAISMVERRQTFEYAGEDPLLG